MTDIVERLRAQGADAFAKQYSLGMFKLCAEAADEIERLRVALSEADTIIGNDVLKQMGHLRAASEWRDISTAPRDGQLAIVYRPLANMSGDQPVAVKRLIEGNYHCWASTVPLGEKPNNPTDGSCHVTHWMHLPAPPQSNKVTK